MTVAAIVALVLAILLLFLIALAVEIVIHDFMLPHMALENASVAEAWRAVRQRIAAEKGSFFLYALLRVLLPIAAGIALILAAILPLILSMAVVVLIAHGFNGFFAGASGGLAAAGLALRIFLAVMGLAGIMIAYFCLVGPIATWSREYALLYYGGRYQPLGDLLFPPPPPLPLEESPQIA